MKKWFSVPVREGKEEEDSMCPFYVLGRSELQAEKRLQVGCVLYCKLL